LQEIVDNGEVFAVDDSGRERILCAARELLVQL
jgi:hypothetical protein